VPKQTCPECGSREELCPIHGCCWSCHSLEDKTLEPLECKRPTSHAEASPPAK
jgi:hypothetical protein